jgi:hypothetical protein
LRLHFRASVAGRIKILSRALWKMRCAVSKSFDQQERGTAKSGKTNYGDPRAAENPRDQRDDRARRDESETEPCAPTAGTISLKSNTARPAGSSIQWTRQQPAFEPPKKGNLKSKSLPKKVGRYRSARARRKAGVPQVQCVACHHAAYLSREVWEEMFHRNRGRVLESANRFKCKRCGRRGGIRLL